MNRGMALKIFYFFERDVDRGSGSFAAGCLLAVLSIVFMIGVPALLPAYFMSYSIEEAEKVAMAFVLGSGLLTLVIAATALTLCCKTSRSFSDLFILFLSDRSRFKHRLLCWLLDCRRAYE